jgi:hypothetical protein
VLKQSVDDTASQFQQLLGNASAAGGSGNTSEAQGGNRSVNADALREFVNRTMDNAGRWVAGCAVGNWRGKCGLSSCVHHDSAESGTDGGDWAWVLRLLPLSLSGCDMLCCPSLPSSTLQPPLPPLGTHLPSPSQLLFRPLACQ